MDTAELHIGFTGARAGMTERQQRHVTFTLQRLRAQHTGPVWLHHGDCVGADEQAHHLAVACGFNVAIHPPTVAKLRAWCTGAHHYEPLPYLERDRAIVANSRLLIATPGCPEQDAPRSGTWYTIRCARRHGIPVHLYLPASDQAA